MFVEIILSCTSYEYHLLGSTGCLSDSIFIFTDLFHSAHPNTAAYKVSLTKTSSSIESKIKSQQLHYRAAASSRVVISVNFELISINKVDVCFPFPRVGDPCDWDQLYGLTLQTKKKKNEHCT